MAYNPFDDVIDQDPAYMANGGQPYRAGQAYQERITKPAVQEDIARGSETMANIARGPVNFIGDVFAQTLGRVAENMVNPEAAERGRQKFANIKEAAKMFGKVPGQLTQSDKTFYEQRTGKKVEQLDFVEGINMPLDFILSDAIAGSNEIQAGKNFTDLDGTKQLGVALLPIEFWFGGAGARKGVMKGAEEFKKQYAGKQIVEVINDPKIAAEYPDVIAEMKSTYPMLVIGKGVDEGRIALAPEKGFGLGGGRPGVSPAQQKRLDEQREETLKLAEVLRKDLDEDKNLTIQQLVEKYELKGITLKDRKDLKNTTRELLKQEVPELYEARRAQSQKNIGFQKGKAGDEQLLEYLKKKRESGEKFESFTKIADDLVSLKETVPGLKVVNRKSLTKRYNENPEFAELFDEIIERPERIQAATDRFQEAYSKVPLDNKLKLIGEETIKDINPQMFDSITRLSGEAGKKGVTDANKLFRQFLYDKYRSIKESKNPQGIVTEDDFFTKLKLSDKDIEDLKSEFSDYAMLERDRLYMQKEGLNFMNRLLENPQYRPYLINPETGNVDQKLFTVNKLHDVPLFEARKEGQGRLKKVGRFLNTGTDPEFLNPHFQSYNRLMVDLDPTLNKLADILNQKGLMKRASIMNAEVIPKVRDSAGNLKTPKSRINFVTEGIVNLINNKGFNLDPTGKKQDVFLREVAEAIDDIYKERGLRAVVPTLKGAKKESQIFGVENPKAIDLDTKIDQYKEALLNALNYAVENKISPQDFRTKPKKEGGIGFIKSLKKGGPVFMAIGGDPLQNINQQQFTPDPAIDEDFFQQAVESENLLAFNPIKIFQKFGEVKAVDTPKKKIETDAPVGPPGSNLPTTQDVQPDDFAFKSFTLEKIVSPTAPKSARPQDWANFLTGGDSAPLAELKDSGIEQYLRDFEKYFPNQKITQEQLVDYYETSPMGNLAIKVKEADPIPLSDGDLKMMESAGQPRHRNVGNQPLDEVGKQYREIVVTAGRLPGETKPFVSSGHFSEENVIGFTRVADYDTPSGQKVAVIQELQTDMLTQVRKEQERVKALFTRIEKIKEKANRLLQSTDEFDRKQGQQLLDSINNAVSEKQLKMLQDNPTLIKPFPNEAAKGLIPQYAEEIDILQNQIDAAVKSDLRARKPETQFVIKSIAEKQQEVLDNLLDLNRAGELDRDLAKVQVPGGSQSNEIAAFGETDDAISDYYSGMKDLQIFPAIPFNKQADYVDLLVKSTIKDAESKGIQKVAIMPAEKVNQRWGKNPDGPEGKKFKNLYDKVVKQQMQNIAKKYGATFQVEQIVDPTKANRGIKFLNKGVDGDFQLLKDLEPKGNIAADEIDDFFNAEIERIALDYGPNEVIVRREVAPGQTMEYFVKTKEDRGIELIPLGDADRAENATIIIEEYNPSLVDMFVLTMPDEAADKPFFLFKKKDGGSIAKDSLVSITDIFGEYGR